MRHGVQHQHHRVGRVGNGAAGVQVGRMACRGARWKLVCSSLDRERCTDCQPEQDGLQLRVVPALVVVVPALVVALAQVLPCMCLYWRDPVLTLAE